MDFKLSMTSRLICNLGHNKIEQQTPIPPAPKSRTKPRERQIRAVFPSLILWGENGGGWAKFSIYFVQFCNLGQNKMEQKNPSSLSPPPTPKARMKPREGQKLAIFPSLILGGGSRVSIYFVQFCNLGQNKMEQKNPSSLSPPPTPKARMKPREGQKLAIFPSLILGGGSRVSIYFVQECGSRLERVKVVFGLGQIGPVISQLQAI